MIRKSVQKYDKINIIPVKLDIICSEKRGQTSEHIFAPNGDYRVYYPSNLLRNARSFENWGIFSK